MLDQLGRRRVPVPWFERLRDMAGLSEIELAGDQVVLAGVFLVVAALVLGLAAVLAWRTRPGRLAVVVLTASWLVLLAAGVGRGAEAVDAATWWGQGRWWPLLVAALLAAVVVHAPRVPARVRPWAAGLALVPVVVAASSPASCSTSGCMISAGGP